MGKKVEIAVKSDVGMVRTENQDHYYVYDSGDAEIERTKGALLVVADGMGGHSGGQIASHTTVDAIDETFSASTMQSMHDLLEESVLMAQEKVREKANADPDLVNMGTTCVALLVRGHAAMIAHVGDSRCYLFRKGNAEVVTRDHTYINELIDIGLLTEEQAHDHPDKNIITRCVGMDTKKLEIDYNRRELEPGDIFLLCSDGLSNLVETAEMAQILSEMSPDDACGKLIAMANSRGGDDNITVGIASVHELPEQDKDLASLDSEDAQYSSKMTPVINRDDLPTELVQDRPSIAGDDTPPTEVPEKGDLGSGSSKNRSAAEPVGSSNMAWYWLIGAEVLVMVLLQIWLGRY